MNGKESVNIHLKIYKTNGRTLVLFRTTQELAAFKEYVSKEQMSVPFLYEGDQEISQLVSRFQNEEETVLCAVHLWEGLDIPGSSLSHVIIWSLPFLQTILCLKRNVST